jgi:inhibitor of cysteine peptidase
MDTMRMPNKTASLSVMVFMTLGLLALGCGGGGGSQGGGGKSLEFTDPSVPIVVNSGDEFVIVLDSNPTTGYSWAVAGQTDPRVVEIVGSNYVAPDTELVGAPGKDYWTFKAAGKGNTSITLEYGRPWEQDQPPADQMTFQVEVN